MINLKKNSFLEGSFIATASIIFVKLLGMLYVIPFYAIVGTKGASLYAYAYTIYNIFLDVASAGLPIAISKLINEYNTLDKKEAKVRAYKIGKKIVSIFSIVSFVIVFCFAEVIGKLILGDLSGGNTIKDVAFVIRCISLAILVIPYLAVSKGYLQGHHYIKAPSVSQVLEQVVRIFIIIVGSYLTIKVFHLSATLGVGIAVTGALAGGIVACLYIRKKLKENKTELGLDEALIQKNDSVTNKEIVKKIFGYAIPFIIIDTAASIYSFMDMVLIIRTLNYLSFSAHDVEFIASSIITYAPKINMIIAAIATGMSVSLIPTIVSAYVKKDWKDVNKKLNNALQIILVISIPMAVGISLLAGPIWSLFYKYNSYGVAILTLSIFNAILTNCYVITSSTLQGLNKFKTVYLATILGFLTNGILDVPLMLLFNYLKIPAYFGAIVATMIGYSLSIFIGLFTLHRQNHISYKETFKVVLKLIVPLIAMILVVTLLKMIIPFNIASKISCIIYIGICALLGATVFIIISYKMGILTEVFGKKFINKIIKKLTLGRVKLGN